MAQNIDEIPAPAADRPLNPAAVAVGDLARMLGLAEAVVRRHLADGAPTNADGTVNLVHYAAWLNAPRANEGQ